MWTFLDDRDEASNINRRGAEHNYTANIESKAIANSLALDVGFAQPFPDVCLPCCPKSEELLGLDCIREQEKYTAVEIGTDGQISDAPNFETSGNSSGDGEDDDDDDDDCSAEADGSNILDNVDALNAILNWGIEPRGTTFDAYMKLSGGSP